tara:strand:+ start:13 stop:513 length:501 start_codon:yes stop_codon:yes gene_type:complete
MKTRSITVGVGIALMIGMLTAGTVNIIEAERQNRRERWNITRDRRETWEHNRERFRGRNGVERYRQLWFNTTFMLELDDATLIRAKDVYSRALHDINQEHQTKDRKEVFEMFVTQLRRTIGSDNFDKLLSVRVNRTRRNIKIGEQGRSRKKGGGKTDTHKTKKKNS